jgi:hypothetical protein
MLKFHFLQTVCRNSDMFRLILIILRDLLKIKYIKFVQILM